MTVLSRMSCLKPALASASLLAILSISCRSQEVLVPVDAPPPQTVRIGLIPEQNIFSQKKRYEPLANYLSEKVGATIELNVLSRYGNIIENFVSNELDGAFFGSFTGALAHRKLGVEALARPEWLDGTSTYHGLLFVRNDSGIDGSDEMRGKRFAFVDKATTAGWLLPLHYFKIQGIDDHQTWLAETYFTGTHEGAIYDVLDRKTDIGAAKNTVFQRLADGDPRISDELAILTRSPDVPANGLCVRKDLALPLKNRLRETLLNMAQDEEGKEVLRQFGAVRFIATTEEDYTPVFAFAEKIGLDLETYDYIND
jgi:phosphonate transport system substrate-binding protein